MIKNNKETHLQRRPLLSLMRHKQRLTVRYVSFDFFFFVFYFCRCLLMRLEIIMNIDKLVIPKNKLSSNIQSIQHWKIFKIVY